MKTSENVLVAEGELDEEQLLDMYLGEDDIKGALGPMLGEIIAELRGSRDKYQRASDLAGSNGY